jgi:hypothetical protein
LVLLDSDQVLETYLDLFLQQVLNVARGKHEVALTLRNNQVSVLLSVPFVCNCHCSCFKGNLYQVFFHG